MSLASTKICRLQAPQSLSVVYSKLQYMILVLCAPVMMVYTNALTVGELTATRTATVATRYVYMRTHILTTTRSLKISPAISQRRLGDVILKPLLI